MFFEVGSLCKLKEGVFVQATLTFCGFVARPQNRKTFLLTLVFPLFGNTDTFMNNVPYAVNIIATFHHQLRLPFFSGLLKVRQLLIDPFDFYSFPPVEAKTFFNLYFCSTFSRLSLPKPKAVSEL